jgi:hypothetical protein
MKVQNVMMRVCVAVVCTGAVGVLGVGGCASSGTKVHAARDASQAQAMFDKVKSLEGTWEMVDEKGEKHVGAEYRVVSAGSVVCERMFPGSAHEMVNMYHLDGDRFLVTHYCAMGTQVRMQASSWATPTMIAFRPESVTNLPTPGTEYMAELELTMQDADNVTQKWISQKSGAKTSHTEFALMRKK